MFKMKFKNGDEITEGAKFRFNLSNEWIVLAVGSQHCLAQDANDYQHSFNPDEMGMAEVTYVPADEIWRIENLPEKKSLSEVDGRFAEAVKQMEHGPVPRMTRESRLFIETVIVTIEEYQLQIAEELSDLQKFLAGK